MLSRVSPQSSVYPSPYPPPPHPYISLAGAWHAHTAQGICTDPLHVEFLQPGTRQMPLPEDPAHSEWDVLLNQANFPNSGSSQALGVLPVCPPILAWPPGAKRTGLESRLLPVDVPLLGRTNRDSSHTPQGFPSPEHRGLLGTVSSATSLMICH